MRATMGHLTPASGDRRQGGLVSDGAAAAELPRVVDQRELATVLELHRPRHARLALSLAGAWVLGTLLATASVMANFVLFNFILHWGS